MHQDRSRVRTARPNWNLVETLSGLPCSWPFPVLSRRHTSWLSSLLDLGSSGFRIAGVRTRSVTHFDVPTS